MNEVQVVCHFNFLCTKTWDDLQEISGTKTERFCSECSKPVYWVASYQQLKEHIKKSHCIALKENDGTFVTGAVWRANKVEK